MKLKDFDFRVWNHEEKQFIAGIVIKKYSGFDGLRQDVEIELWTGLCDKNKKKVYENDIVKVKSPYDCFIAKISIHKEGTFYLEGKNGDYMGSLIYLVEDEAYTIEIIGNIHENPELLKN
ncbi:hypothetical protein BXA13_07480 [Campylobacter lari]|uniref:YopX protein domain-containing protein n=1 Tax=Campylobacter lari TaxID=201 RepID=A0A7U8GG22_CAMLA|nr:hypothetical protein [Campylobacter lari]